MNHHTFMLLNILGKETIASCRGKWSLSVIFFNPNFFLIRCVRKSYSKQRKKSLSREIVLELLLARKGYSVWIEFKKFRELILRHAAGSFKFPCLRKNSWARFGWNATWATRRLSSSMGLGGRVLERRLALESSRNQFALQNSGLCVVLQKKVRPISVLSEKPKKIVDRFVLSVSQIS